MQKKANGYSNENLKITPRTRNIGLVFHWLDIWSFFLLCASNDAPKIFRDIEVYLFGDDKNTVYHNKSASEINEFLEDTPSWVTQKNKHFLSIKKTQFVHFGNENMLSS